MYEPIVSVIKRDSSSEKEYNLTVFSSPEEAIRMPNKGKIFLFHSSTKDELSVKVNSEVGQVMNVCVYSNEQKLPLISFQDGIYLFSFLTEGSRSIFHEAPGFCIINIELYFDKNLKKNFYAEFEIISNKSIYEEICRQVIFIESKCENITRQKQTSSYASYLKLSELALSYKHNKQFLYVEYIIKHWNTYKENIITICHNTYSYITDTYHITNNYEKNIIDSRAIEYSISKGSLLSPCEKSKKNSFPLNRKHYFFNKMVVNKKIEDYSIYENKILIGWLVDILYTINHIEVHIAKLSHKKEIGSIEAIYNNFLQDQMRDLSKIKNEISSIYHQFIKKIGNVKAERNSPKITPLFQRCSKYSKIFCGSSEWFMKKASLFNSDENNPYHIRSMPDIYEYFCFFQLINIIEKKGFSFSENSMSKNLLENKDGREIRSSVYELTDKNHNSIKIYFNFTVKNKKNDILNLISTRYAEKRPDYILEFNKNDGQREHHILDAKFSSIKNVLSEEKLEEIIDKYYTYSIDIDYLTNNIKSVSVIYPFIDKLDDILISFNLRNNDFGYGQKREVLPNFLRIPLNSEYEDILDDFISQKIDNFFIYGHILK